MMNIGEYAVGHLFPVVLIVEDDHYLRRFLRIGLEARGFAVRETLTIGAGLSALPTCKPHAIILDLGSPDMDRLKSITSLRASTSQPLIVLSNSDQVADKVAVLDAGADDCLDKPFALEELLARLRAVLRRAAPPSANDMSEVFKTANLSVNLAEHQVIRDGKKVHLTPIEYRLLAALVKHAGKLLTQPQLLSEVWGPSHVDNSNYLRVYMGGLRRKLERDPARPQLLFTERGVGYRLACN